MQSVRLLRSAVHLSSLLQRPLFVNSQRSFSCTAQRWNEEKQEVGGEEAAAAVEEEAEQQAEPVKLSRRRRRFHEWVQGSGAKFIRPADGTTNYLGTTPFPTNPLFKPRPPLSDARREEIYATYKEDPEKWTIRKLATQFGLSMRRVEAVLKLKEAEKQMEASGISLQRKFAKGMERLMGADQNAQVLREPLVDVFPTVKKPTFKVLEEDAEFGIKDASQALNRKPFKEIEETAIKAEEAKFSKTQRETPTSSSEKPQKKFVIIDTSR